MSAPSITPGIRKVFLVDAFTGLPVGPDGGPSSSSLIYFAVANGIAVVVAQDLWEVTAAGANNVIIRGVLLNQYSDFGDAQAELLSVSVLRGLAAGAGSGGTPVTPVPRRSDQAPATATIVRNNTGLGASNAGLIADGWNVAAGWTYLPNAAERIELLPGERAMVRINAPADSLTINQTLVIEERPPTPAPTAQENAP